MIGKHLTDQPLHLTLRQYRIIAVTSIVFLGWMLLKVWGFYELNYTTMSAEAAVAFFSFVGTILGAFMKCVNNIQGRHEE